MRNLSEKTEKGLFLKSWRHNWHEPYAIGIEKERVEDFPL